MNSKYLVQFIFYLLFGFMAMAEPGENKRSSHAGDFVAYDVGTPDESVDIVHKQSPVVAPYNLPGKKQLLLRARFRAASYFKINLTETAGPVAASFPLTGTALHKSKTPHLPPFYYIFLFRLTPF